MLKLGTESDALLARISGPALTERELALLAIACADQVGLSAYNQRRLANLLASELPGETE